MNSDWRRFSAKYISAFSGIFILTLSAAHAETLKEHYASYCQQDRNNKNGYDAPVKDEIAKTLTKLRILIHATGKKYGVDPRAIAGSILAEHSMNTGAKDIAENFLVKIGATPTGEIFGKKFTFGFGQLHFERAKAAEVIAASIENRAIYSDHEISQNILTPEGSINYIGALIKQAQDIYKAGGYDISNDTAVTTTLYNIGKVQERLIRAKKENRAPGPNYFGCFVAGHISEIESIIGPPPKIEATHFEEQPASPSTASTASTPASAEASKAKPPIQYYLTKADLKLSNGPKDCYDEPMFPVNNRPVASGSQLKLIGKAVDCDLKPWVLVRSTDGASGWIERKELQNASSMKSFAAENCSLAQPSDCKTKLQKTYSSFFRNENSNGELSFSLRSSGGEVQKTSGPLKYSGSSNQFLSNLKDKKNYEAYQKIRPLTDSEIGEIEKEIESYKKRVQVALKLPAFDDPASNPYYIALDNNALYMQIKKYRYYQKQNLADDQIDQYYARVVANAAAFKAFFKNAPVIPKPKEKQLEDVSYPGSNDFNLAVFSSLSHLKQELRQLNPSDDIHQLFDTFNMCQSTFAQYPKLYNQFLTTQSQLMDASNSPDFLKSVVLTYFGRINSTGNLPLKDICQSIRLLDTMDEKSVQPQSDCDLTILDTGAELAKAFKVPLSTAAELLKTRESREAMLFAALSPLAKTTNDVSYLRAHAKDQKPSSQPSSQPSSPPPAQSPSQQQSQPTSLRELAKALASESCVKSVYVPEPWLATPDKTTYRPNKSNTVSVDYATETCTQPLGDKQ